MVTSSRTRIATVCVLTSLLILPVSWAVAEDAGPSLGGGSVRGEQAYPTGNPATSILLIQHVGPSEMRVNVAFAYEVRITNLTDATLGDLVVVITEKLPNAFKVDRFDPAPAETGENTATWNLPKLGPKGVHVIKISGVPTAVGEIPCCTQVVVRTEVCASVKIVEPALKLTKTAPAEVMVCDTIPMKLVVTNTGTGTVNNVKVTDKLPQGWRTEDGKDALAFDAGTLRPGESREISFQARSSNTGNFTNEATASEPGGLTAKARSQTVVRKPVLALTKTGPDMRYIGRPADYKITVSNTGDAPARDTVLVDTVSGVGEFVKATDDGQFAGGKVTWSLGTLAPGASKTVGVTLVGQKAGTIKDDAVATAYCAEARGAASTVVRGVPAVLLEVVDNPDPIEVGSTTTYTIEVTNQGTADDGNIRIECTLPTQEEFVSAEGPTKFKVDGKRIVFEPVPSLAPKAKITYRVVVKGTAAADVRFKASLTSDMLTSPVQETESTHIY